MLRRHEGIWRTLFMASDVAISLGVFSLAYFLRFNPPVSRWSPPVGPVPPLRDYLGLLPVLGLLLLITNGSQRLYVPRREGSFITELAGLVKSTVLAVVLLTAFLFFDRSRSYARGIVAIFAVLNPAAAFAFRVAVRSALRFARRRGRNLRHVVVVGTGRTAQALTHRIRRNPWTGLRIIGLVAERPDRAGRTIHDLPVLGTTEEIDAVLDRHHPDQVFIALPPERAGEVEPLVRKISDRLVGIRIVPDLGVLLGLDHRTDDFDGLPIVSLWESPISGWSALGKRAMDFTVALAVLAITAPLLALIAALVKATSPGPVFYRQPRMGLDGRLFQILKFRTMWEGADDGGAGGWTKPGDARCTPLGRVLRRTSLDELPQLFNVIAGQMSLVGPRPERPVFIEKFRRKVPRYMLRHKVKSGVTGWAQVNGWRGDTSLRKRIQYDLYYLEHWSLGLDLKILALTLVRGFIHPNAY